MIKKKNSLLTIIFLLISWISFWLSINTKPNEIEPFFKTDIISIINTFRISIPLLLSIAAIPLVIFFIYRKKLFINTNTINKLIFLFFVYFSLQGLGLYYNNLLDFNLNNSYLIILAIGALEIIFFVKIFSLNKNLNFFLYINIFIITIISLILTTILIKDNDISNISFYFYYYIDPDKKIFEQTFPRITGLSRMISVINLGILASFLFIEKKDNLKKIEFILIIILSMLIWGCQSRGTILCFVISTCLLIYFYKNYNIKKKIFTIFFIIIFPIIIFESYKVYKINILEKEIMASNLEDNIKKNKLYQLDKSNINRIEKSNQYGSSGRIYLWKNIIEKYDKRKIFGYGPQADRHLISSEIYENYGSNVSNGFFYAFACGGYFALIIFILINVQILIFIYKSIFIKKIFIINKYFAEKLATIYLIFFGIRVLFENSYSVFSVDFLMTLICFFIIANYFDKKPI
jgi:hypothetical protein